MNMDALNARVQALAKGKKRANQPGYVRVKNKADRWAWVPALASADTEYTIERTGANRWKVVTPHGEIEYRHRPDDDRNEIRWVESYGTRHHHGSELVDLMQRLHPAGAIAWGFMSSDGVRLQERWHAAHPDIEYVDGALFFPHESPT